MKNKSSLSLIEQVIMIMVFAVSAAVSLRIFTYADSLSKSNALKDRAVLYAQNAAEAVIQARGDLTAAAELAGGTYTGDGFVKNCSDSEEGDTLKLSVERTASGNELLGKARIEVYGGEECVYSIEGCWQEGTDD